MKLSELLRAENFQFDFTEPSAETPGRYMDFAGCARKALGLPEHGDGQIAERFPLAMACPLFVGSQHLPTELVIAALPEGCRLPNQPGIYFLADAIDLMAVRLKMSREKIADVVQAIERSFVMHNLDLHGRPNGRRLPI